MEHSGASRASEVANADKDKVSDLDQSVPSEVEEENSVNHANQRTNSNRSPLTNEDAEPKPSDVLQLTSKTRTAQHEKSESSEIPPTTEGTNVDFLLQRLESFTEFLCQLGLEKNFKDKFSVSYSQTLKACILSDSEAGDIFDKFISKTTSYDHRVQQISHHSDQQGNEAFASNVLSGDKEIGDEDWFTEVQEEQTPSDSTDTFSSRDILFAVLNCLDPFLFQEVLMKLSACQLAVPLIMPNFNGTPTLNVWGLQKISKSWYDFRDDSIHAETIVNHPFLAVAALRMGDICISKSNVLNKLLGPAQGNDEHAYFLSQEQDPHSVVWSKGSLECVWFLPKEDADASNIRTSFALLNLRGGYSEFQPQVKFAIKKATVTIIFIDFNNMSESRIAIDEAKSQSYVILVVSGSTEIRQKPKYKTSFSIVYAKGYNALEVSKLVSKILKEILERDENPKTLCIEKEIESCKDLTIDVDELHPKFISAKALAMSICNMISKQRPNVNKCNIFGLQAHWKEWAKLDKDKTLKSNNIEKDIQEIKNKKRSLRLKQAKTALSQVMDKFCKACDLDTEERHLFIGYLQFFLNAISNSTFKPLLQDLHSYSAERWKISNDIKEITSKQSQENSDLERESNKDALKDIQELKRQEEIITRKEKECIQKIDDSTFGIELFLREIGQMYECQVSVKSKEKTFSIDTERLPWIAVDFLTNGYPIEIMDGDANHVPLLWVREILNALSKRCGQVKVYVVSVLGIQSSGKSTLLNSMFGVRFSVRAGRCTKGAFLQLLPVERELKEYIDCDYIFIVDTEGLGVSSEFQSFPEHDNELATFVMCISDLTLINIGGQTMGEEMSNVLQIAAHAFIRMKEVNLTAECRVVQQFVADVTAEQRNEAAMQNIMMKLDNAISKAAKKEGKDHLYRQFSDVFSVQNYKSDSNNVQCIPSLWRGFMSAPDHQYSTRVQQLKRSIVQSIKTKPNKLNIMEFSQRVADVWTAIKKEDFVFSFQNSKEITLFEDLMTIYRTWISPIRVQIIEKELQARQNIENSKTDNIQDIQRESVHEIKTLLEEECRKVKEKIASHLKMEKYNEISRYALSFYSDLEAFKTQITCIASSEIQHFASLCMKTRNKDPEKEALSADLHEKVAILAGEIRKQIDQQMAESKGAFCEADTFITTKFDEFWESGIGEIDAKYPLTNREQISRDIENKFKQCIRDEVKNKTLAATVLHFLNDGSIDECSISSSCVNTLSEINKRKRLFNTVHSAASMEFDLLVQKIQNYADSNAFFKGNVSCLLNDCSTFLNKYESLCDKTTVLCFCLSLFIRISQVKQVDTELRVVTGNYDSVKAIGKERNVFLEKELQESIRGVILSAVQCHLMENTEDNREHEIEALKVLLNTSDTKTEGHNPERGAGLKAARSYLKKIIVSPWTDKYEQFLHKLMSETEKKYSFNMCGIESVHHYCQKAVKHCYERVPAEHFHEAIKLAYHYGFEKFRQFSEGILKKHIDSPEYVIKFAEPLDYPSITHKLDFILVRCKDMLPGICPITSELTEDMVRKYGFSTFPFNVVQHLDPKFVRILPLRKEEVLRSVHEKVNTIKKSCLLHETYKPPFNTVAVSKVLSDITNETDRDLFPNELMAPTLVHVCAWLIPFCAVAQYEFEKSQNPAVLLRKERDLFLSQFKSLCSERYDKIVAKTFVDVIFKTAQDSWKYKVYPELVRELMDQSIFKFKKSFIGTVLLDICERDSYQDIVGFLKDFKGFSQQWILKYVFANCNREENPLLQVIVDKSIQDIKYAALYSASKSDETLEDGSLSEWLNVFCRTMLDKASFTCEENEIEKLRSYLKVSKLKVFSDESKMLLQNLDKELKRTIKLPLPGEVEQTKEWLTNALPKQIHLELFEQLKGCNEQCPFCGAVCEESLNVHNKHKVNLHFPQGIKGRHWILTEMLVTDICTSSVESEARYRTPTAVKNPEFRQYKKYHVDYPTWYIQGIRDDKPTEYWQYIFAKYNTRLATRYEIKEADVPIEWTKISKEEAMECVKTTYQLN